MHRQQADYDFLEVGPSLLVSVVVDVYLDLLRKVLVGDTTNVGVFGGDNFSDLVRVYVLDFDRLAVDTKVHDHELIRLPLTRLLVVQDPVS